MAILALAAMLTGCGYHLAGTADTIPKSVKTIAVPAFGNATTRYRLTDRLPNMIAREFNSRTRYEVIQDESQADAILRGSIINVYVGATTVNPNTGRAAAIETQVILSIRLHERTTGKVLYEQPYYAFRQTYEIAAEPEVYFDESTAAFDRLGRDVARTVVSAVLENF